mmetsp:Transcript_2857/g.6069  ORF Transcript_2857/g.6069 Transcript_2857/m.6069 type:complete len:494 (+) Transcript_2857:80-1561(+)
MGCGASKGRSSSNAIIDQEWPPKADADELHVTGREMTLPESIYWNYVRPFTPITDRAVVNKRCSTAFYAGHRVNLDDEKSLERYERRENEVLVHHGVPCFWDDGNEAIRFRYLPVARGQPGTKQFRIEISDSYNSTSRDDHFATDPKVALEKLRRCRQVWDEHMALIPYHYNRLRVCLEVLHSNGVYVSFLFDGNGTIEDVVNFHASVNTLALNGPASPPPRAQHEIQIFPNTQLGYWVTRCLVNFQQELVSRMQLEEGEVVRCQRYGEESIVDALLEAGADVSAFFEPLIDYPYHTLSVLTLLEDISGGYGPGFETGMSLHEVMRAKLLWFKQQEHILGCVCGFQGIVESLASKSNIKLRFDMGSWVECNVGCQHHHEWMSGVVTGHWIDGQPYTVALDEGSVYVPNDEDKFIRRPALRFQVGDRVECNLYKGDGWAPGIVAAQWPDDRTIETDTDEAFSAKGAPYAILLPKERQFMILGVDQDSCIRALSE